MDQIIEDLNWRYATDKFDPYKKISQKDLETLLEVIRLAPSSYGLQPLKILVIEDPSIRKELRERSWNQPQITDASHLLILCSQTTISEKDIDDLMHNTAITRGLEQSSLTRYSDFLKRTIGKIQEDHMREWNMRQAYIALGHLLHACAQLKIDSTPMEGFDADAYADILDLNAKHLTPAVVCAIGYRSIEDEQQYLPKIRKSLRDIVDYI
jgi:nitroreductase